MEEILKTLDEELELLESRVGEKRIILKTKRVSEWAKCPVCGQLTQKVHSWYWKHVADLPAMGKMVILEVQRRLFLCTNPDCSQKRFSEPMEYLNWSGKRTRRLDNLIEKIAANHSAHGLEKILRNDIVDISDDSILRLIKKKESNQHALHDTSE
ncbi:MAG TPA: transposase family protein [Thermotogota bacterium]|nr:transposase family protein [Thermotogota bacterium]